MLSWSTSRQGRLPLPDAGHADSLASIRTSMFLVVHARADHLQRRMPGRDRRRSPAGGQRMREAAGHRSGAFIRSTTVLRSGASRPAPGRVHNVMRARIVSSVSTTSCGTLPSFSGIEQDTVVARMQSVVGSSGCNTRREGEPSCAAAECVELAPDSVGPERQRGGQSTSAEGETAASSRPSRAFPLASGNSNRRTTSRARRPARRNRRSSDQRTPQRLAVRALCPRIADRTVHFQPLDPNQDMVLGAGAYVLRPNRPRRSATGAVTTRSRVDYMRKQARIELGAAPGGQAPGREHLLDLASPFMIAPAGRRRPRPCHTRCARKRFAQRILVAGRIRSATDARWCAPGAVDTRERVTGRNCDPPADNMALAAPFPPGRCDPLRFTQRRKGADAPVLAHQSRGIYTFALRLDRTIQSGPHASFTNSSREKWISVSVPTVLLLPPRLVRSRSYRRRDRAESTSGEPVPTAA